MLKTASVLAGTSLLGSYGVAGAVPSAGQGPKAQEFGAAAFQGGWPARPAVDKTPSRAVGARARAPTALSLVGVATNWW